LRQQLLIVLLVAGMTTVITLALFMERSINQPIRALLGTMAAVEQGDLAPPTPFTRRDEMGRLARGLATMLGRIRESQEEEARLLDQISRFNQELRTRVAEATEELGRRNEALQRANELLFDLHRRLARAERLAAMGELTATIAHEIGTPLNAVAVHLQLLARSGGLTAEDRQRLITIEEQIQRLVTTVQGFLAATRGDARGQELVDLNQLVRGVTDLMAPALEAKGIRVHFALMETLPKILADAHQIQQLILNLITNAVDAMSTGGSLRTETAVGDGSVILRVMDSGPGVPVDVRRRIFEPFFTTKALGEGTGLGLAVCRRIAEGHHGSIQALETPGGGATFEVRLPTAPVEESR
jgi:signal transduction histidine kinase